MSTTYMFDRRHKGPNNTAQKLPKSYEYMPCPAPPYTQDENLNQIDSHDHIQESLQTLNTTLEKSGINR